MYGKSRRYMSKRHRACDFCRSKKAACRIESAPPCYVCALHGRDCTFLHSANSLRSSKPVRHGARESPTTQVDGQTPGSSHIADSAFVDIFQPIQHNSATENGLDINSNFENIFDSNHAGLHGSFEDIMWPPGFTPGSVVESSTSIPSLGPAVHHSPYAINDDAPTVDLEENNHSSTLLLGPTSDMDPALLRHYRYAANRRFTFKELNIQSVDTEGHPTQFLQAPSSIFSASREETGSIPIDFDVKREELQAIIPPAIGARLIALFQNFVAPQYPIFSTKNRITTETSPPHLLASIYLLVEPLAKFDEKLCIDLAYEKLSSKGLLKVINDTLSYEIYSPNIATIQTLLLSCARPYPDPIVQDIGLKWSYLSTLVACAQSLGLHLNPRKWKISPHQVSLRRRLSHCIYQTDKWLALSLGRPPLLDAEKWLVTTVDNDDRLASGLDSYTWSLVLKQADLDIILDECLHKLYTPRAIDSTYSDFEKTATLTQPLLEIIRIWNQHFIEPSQAGLSDSTKIHQGLARIMQVHQHYIHLTILRARIRPYMHVSLDEGFAHDFEAIRDEMRVCLDSCVALVHDLGPNDHEIQWPSWISTAFSSICFQILLMTISSINAEEATYWFGLLHQVRRDMRLKADTLPCLRLGLLRIDSIFWKGIDNVFSLDPHVRQVCCPDALTDE